MTDPQQTIAWLFRRTEGRCLEMFAKSIQHANDCGSSKWGVTHYGKNRVRLIVGGIVVCTLHTGRIWFALDKDYQNSNDYVILRDSGDWAPTPRVDYKVVPSISGYYIPSQRHSALWPRIKRMHFSLIEIAADKYTKLREPCLKAHSADFLEYLRGELKLPNLRSPDHEKIGE